MLEFIGSAEDVISAEVSDISLNQDEQASSPNNNEQLQEQQDWAEKLDDLVLCVAAAFRGHPHINNVLTHISRGNWNQVEQALRTIFDPCAGSRAPSPLARNIVELMCADRGVTGRILKPFYRDRLTAILGDRMASRMVAHINCLFLEYEIRAQTALSVNPTNAPASTSSEEAR